MDRSSYMRTSASLSHVIALTLSASALITTANAQWIANAAGGTDARVTVLQAAGVDQLYVGGDFQTVGGIASPLVAKFWNGAWVSTPVFNTLPGNGTTTMSLRGNGDLLVGSAKGYFYEWSETTQTWTGRGTAWNGVVAGNAVFEAPNGDILAGGTSTLAPFPPLSSLRRWSGIWYNVTGDAGPSTGATGTVSCMAPSTITLGTELSGVVVGGAGIGFTTVASGAVTSNMAFYSGTTLVDFFPTVAGVAPPLGVVEALFTAANGDLIASHVVGTLPTSPRQVVRWRRVGNSYTSWTDLTVAGGADGAVRDITQLPDGDIVVVGDFQNIGGVAAPSVARLTASAWSSLSPAANGSVEAVAFDSIQGLLIGGGYSALGAAAASNFSRMPIAGPATVVSMQDGCSGAGGVNVLTAESLPFIGTTLRARATGMAPLSLSVNTLGLTYDGSTPPMYLTNCVRGANPDVTFLGVPSGGSVDASFVVANNPALIGAQFFHQVACVELGAGGNITGISTTNTNLLTFGDF